MQRNPLVVYGNPARDIPSHINFAQFIFDQLRKGGNKDAIINGETHEKLTFDQLVERIVQAATGLYELGVRKGDVVTVISENRFEFLITIVAAISCGAVVSTANIAYTHNELAHTLNITKPKYVFVSPLAHKLHYENLKKLSHVKTIIRYGGPQSLEGVDFDDFLKRRVAVEQFEPVDVTGQVDTAAVLFSSGTTGLPKGVMLSHHNMLLSAVEMNDKTFTERKLERFLTIVPWYHAYGSMSTLHLLCANRTVIFQTRFQPDVYLGAARKYKVNMLITVPPMVVFLAKHPMVLDYDLSSVYEIWCAAAPISLDIIKTTQERIPSIRSINQGYGMTETALNVTRDRMVMDGSKAGSGGFPVPGVKIKVVDPETGKILGVRQKGEICVKGPMVMKGYLGDGVSTRDTFDEEGYLKTGDIGYYDEDKYFYIVDRVKELIKYKAYQVPPAEVEAVLLQHPGVAECGVVGAPDPLAGELPTAFVVKQQGATVTEKEIKDFVASKLSPAKRLHGGVRFVKEIPKNPSGKILRRVLKQMISKPSSKL